MAATFAVAAVSMYWTRFRPVLAVPSRRALIAAAIIGYSSAGTVIAVILIWLAP